MLAHRLIGVENPDEDSTANGCLHSEEDKVAKVLMNTLKNEHCLGLPWVVDSSP
jgi:hypothetical protein